MSQKVAPRDMAIVVGSAILGFCIMIAALAAFNCLADIVVKEEFEGKGDWSTLHEGRLSEASGGKNATLSYKYDKFVDESGYQDQNLEIFISGGDGSRWNFVRLGADQVAGHNTVDIYVGAISGTFYAKNGMKISYNEANESREEFESTITIDSRDGSAAISFDVIQWQGGGEPIPDYDDEGNFTGYKGGGTVGKPAAISDLDFVGQFLINQLVQLKEPKQTLKGWLEFCDLLEDKLPDGYKILPSDLKYDLANGTAWDYRNGTVYQIDA